MYKILIASVTALTASLSLVTPAFAQTLSAVCTSSGQMCNRMVNYTLRIDRPIPAGSYLSINLNAPTTHCSPVKYYVILPDEIINTDRFLNPGQSTAIPLRITNPGTYAVKIAAEGKTGGCNVGSVLSWAVGVSTSVVQIPQ